MQTFGEDQGSKLEEPLLTQSEGHHTTFNTKKSTFTLSTIVLTLAPADE